MTGDHHGPSPEPTIREAFLRFDAENPHVFDELERLLRRAQARNVNRVGIKMLFEVLRWRHALATRGDEFKLNNNYHSYYARALMTLEPRFAGVFDVRRLHGPDLSYDDIVLLAQRHGREW